MLSNRSFEELKKNGVTGIGKDQWLLYHFNGNPTRLHDKDNFEVTLAKKASSRISFESACKQVAEELYEINKHRKIFIPMSGGCDSETVANSFYKLKIPFTPIIHDIWSFGMQITYPDTWWAQRWCNERNINPIVKNTSILELFSNIKPLIDQVKGRKLYPAHNILLSEYARLHDGVVINGQAFPEYYPDYTLDYLLTAIKDKGFYDQKGNIKSGWLLHEDDFYIDMYNPGQHTYNFLSWTPDIVRSYVTERDMNLNSEENKFKIMKCSPRPKIGAPDAVWPIIREYQYDLKLKYGTSELSFLGTHEDIINFLE
jgi:hypothetical protein